MFSTNRRTDYLSKDFLWFWHALAFQAGFANAGGFMACSRFVSHTTGFGTQAGVAFAELNWIALFEALTAPFCFIFGAIVSALLVDRPMLQQRNPRYLLVMFMIFVSYASVGTGGALDVFGAFNEPRDLVSDTILMSLLCFGCGMQNACFTSLSRGQMRTTHLTGISTDVGITLVRLLHLDPTRRDTKILKRVNGIRIGTLFFFTAGSAAAAIVFDRLDYQGFFFLAGFAFVMWATIALQQRKRTLQRLHAVSVRKDTPQEKIRPPAVSQR